MGKNDKNGYTLSRQWFEFAFDNPEKISPVHCALYFWCIELNNRLGWREKFGLPTEDTMRVIGVRNKRTYYKAFHNLTEWGFIGIVTKSINQHTANIISLPICRGKKYTSTATGTAPIIKQYKQSKQSWQKPITEITFNPTPKDAK